METEVRYYIIGGLKFQYEEFTEYKVGWEFINRLHDFSSNDSKPTDIRLLNGMNSSIESIVNISSNLPVYEKRYGAFISSVYLSEMYGYIWVTWIKPRSLYLSYAIDSMWTKACLLADYSDTNGLEVFENLADIFAYSAVSLGCIVFHGVVMEYQGRGVILAAPSGTGKTTHSNIWRDLGLSTIINGDRALCRYIDDTWTVFGMPWCGTSGIAENRQVPIQAIVVLEQHSENIVTRLNPLGALTRLLTNTFAPTWEPVLYTKMLDRLDEIIPVVPIFLLRCRPDIDAVMTLKSALDRL